MMLTNHILSISPDTVEFIFCFDELKYLATSSFIFSVKENKKKGGNTSMTRNLKKAALNSLDGKWG
ncbi:hypothetical protein ABH957_005549 [Bacillus sp. RC242]